MKTDVIHRMFIVFAIIFCAGLHAEIPKHNELWSRVFISHSFSEKVRVEGEYQFRWQDTPGSAGLPAYRLQQGMRIWSYYQFKPAWTLGVSPICWFRSYPLLTSSEDFIKPASSELRGAAGCEWKRNFSSCEVKARLNYESRFFNKDGQEEWTRKDRVRGRVTVSHSLACCDSSLAPVSVYAGDEYFFQGQDFFTSENAMDQNRLIGGVAWKVTEWCKIDVMYLHILKKATVSRYLERVVWLNTTFYI